MIDGHFHIWRRADLPWLNGPPQPRIFGEYDAIRRDYPIAEYRAEAEAAGVTHAVYVQANWAPDQGAAEAAWVQATADETGWPHAIVGYADFTVPDVRPQLDALASQPLLRGVRQQLHWHENPQYRFAIHAGLAQDPAVQANVAHLADYDLAFDLQVFAPQMAGAAQLAAACPDVTFVLQHAGMLERDDAESWAAWRAGMRALADQPNVVSKLSGLGTFIRRLDAEWIGRLCAEALTLFGPDRCMWGSNFPIEKLWCGYGELVAAHRAAIPQPDHAAVFDAVAARVYRLN